jgi:hypothetical protein
MIAQHKLQDQYIQEKRKREMVENIRKPMKLKEIYQVTVEQLGTVLNASRCTVHFNMENFLAVEAEYCKPFVQAVTPKTEDSLVTF